MRYVAALSLVALVACGSSERPAGAPFVAADAGAGPPPNTPAAQHQPNSSSLPNDGSGSPAQARERADDKPPEPKEPPAPPPPPSSGN